MWYEAMVKIDEANEKPQLSLRSRLGEIKDCLDLALEGGNALAVDVMTEKVEFLHTKNTFVWIHNNAVGRKMFENCVEMFKVILWCGTGNQNIVDIRVHKLETSECLIHKTLEHLCRIPQAERHA